MYFAVKLIVVGFSPLVDIYINMDFTHSEI